MGKNYSGSPTNYQKKISNNSLPTILWSGFKSVFLLSIEWTQTYVYYYFPPVSLQPKIIKSKKQNLLHHISKKKTEYCLYTYTKLSFLGFWPDSKPIIVTLLHT